MDGWAATCASRLFFFVQQERPARAAVGCKMRQQKHHIRPTAPNNKKGARVMWCCWVNFNHQLAAPPGDKTRKRTNKNEHRQTREQSPRTHKRKSIPRACPRTSPATDNQDTRQSGACAPIRTISSSVHSALVSLPAAKSVCIAGASIGGNRKNQQLLVCDQTFTSGQMPVVGGRAGGERGEAVCLLVFVNPYINSLFHTSMRARGWSQNWTRSTPQKKPSKMWYIRALRHLNRVPRDGACCRR